MDNMTCFQKGKKGGDEKKNSELRNGGFFQY